MSLCLNCIVRNEGEIMQRFLASLDGLIRYACIVDTGSTDDTVSAAEKALAGMTGLEKGVVLHDVWKNFGVNRTNAMRMARAWLSDEGVDLTTTWFLLLDADMIFSTNGHDEEWTSRLLIHPVMTVIQTTPTISYANVRLVRADLDVVCVGSTHEYYDLPDGIRAVPTTECVITDKGDGGCKADKFERDIRLLTDELRDKPDNPRAMFYLGNSLKNAGRHADAIRVYDKRLSLAKQGWTEECYMACLYKGECHEKLGETDSALRTYLDEATRWSPHRSEAMFRAAVMLRGMRRYYAAALVIRRALEIPEPDPTTKLFVEPAVYRFLLHHEASLIAYHVGDIEWGASACGSVIDKGSAHYAASAKDNLKRFYTASPSASGILTSSRYRQNTV